MGNLRIKLKYKSFEIELEGDKDTVQKEFKDIKENGLGNIVMGVDMSETTYIVEPSENAPKQMMKVIEELGETAGAIAKNKATDEIQDGIGDTFVTLIILAYQLGLEPADCLEAAWNEIKDRKGKTENGVFIKEEKGL